MSEENQITEVKEDYYYTPEIKHKAVNLALELGGNLKKVEKALGMQVPYNTIWRWSQSRWWKEQVRDIKKLEKLGISAKAKGIIDEALEQLQERLVQGDYIYDQKTGKLVRKPLTAKDLNTISHTLIERKLQLDRETEDKADIETIDDKLNVLAERFAKLAEKAFKKPEVNVTDVVYVKEEKEE